MAQNTPTEHCPHCRYKSSPRDPETLRHLNNRLKRINGQLAGISRMLEEIRYCGDILLPVAAGESALQTRYDSLLNIRRGNHYPYLALSTASLNFSSALSAASVAIFAAFIRAQL